MFRIKLDKLVGCYNHMVMYQNNTGRQYVTNLEEIENFNCCLKTKIIYWLILKQDVRTTCVQAKIFAKLLFSQHLANYSRKRRQVGVKLIGKACVIYLSASNIGFKVTIDHWHVGNISTQLPAVDLSNEVFATTLISSQLG